MDRLLVVSCDCHAGATPAAYRALLDPDLRERYDAWRADRDALDARLAQCLGLRLADIDARDDAARGERRGALSTYWTAERRLALLDADGIAAEVVFPQPAGDGGPPFYP